MALQPELKLSIASHYGELELVDQVIDSFLQYLHWDEDERPNISLAIREAAANAVQHGSRQDPDKAAVICCSVEDVDTEEEQPGRDLLVEVTDDGPGFDPEAVPDPLAPENLLKPSGRGILLIRNFMDEVSFHFPEAGGTVVFMRKRISASKSRPRDDG